MKFNLYRHHGALNSPKIFDAFSQGLKKIGLVESTDPDAIPVIWSVLWHGRMQSNKQVYFQARNNKIPVIIIEVGNLRRNITWRISVDNVNRDGYFGLDQKLDKKRINYFQNLSPFNENRKESILITAQHTKSLQWPEKLSANEWLHDVVKRVRAYTDRPIIVRPHPRCSIQLQSKDFIIETPRKIDNTYDDYDFSTNYHCVINYNTGPTIHAAIAGTPVICDQSALAYPVSENWENLENPTLVDREKWYLDLCHTEWAVEEIANGIPIQRLVPYLEERISKIS